MTAEKYDYVLKRINKDYMEIVDEFLKKEKAEIIIDAYQLAHYNEIADFFDNVDSFDLPFEEKVFDNILKSEDNIIERVWNSWLNYSHPERYNFFCYEDLTDIIRWEFVDLPK